MVMMATHYQRESADTGRPKNIRVAGSLGATFHDPLMDRSQLIHMITLVRATSRVQERIHSRYQQTTLMHRHRKRTGEYSASLPILESAVAEQQGIMGREVMRHLASLSDKATDNLSGIRDLGSRRDNEILRDHTIPDKYRGLSLTIYGTIFQTCAILYGRVITNLHVTDRTGIDNLDLIANRSLRRGDTLRISGNHIPQAFDQGRTMTVQCDNISQ